MKNVEKLQDFIFLGSGKSHLIAEILNNFTLCTDSKAQPVTVYCYKSQVPETLRPSSTTFTYQGIPNLKALRQKLADGDTPVVLVLDDLLSGTVIFFLQMAACLGQELTPL